LDPEGTLFKHNGYKLDGMDTILPCVLEFLKRRILLSRTIDWSTCRARRKVYSI